MIKKSVVTATADRIDKLPTSIMSELDGMKRSAMRRGKEFTDLSLLKLNIKLPEKKIDDKISEAQIKSVFADFLAKKYNVNIRAEREMLLLAGGRITLLLLAASYLQDERICYLPDPGYPSYRNAATLFGGKIKKYRLEQCNDFLPNLSYLESYKSKSMKIMFINSPHNPSGSVCDNNYYDRLVKTAIKENIFIISDSAYALNSPATFSPNLFCQNRKRLKSGVELFSFSTNFCQPDMKITLVVGLKKHLVAIQGLAKLFGCKVSPYTINASAPLFASAETISSHLENCRHEIAKRLIIVKDVLNNAGIDYYPLISTPFLWVKIKERKLSLSFARGLFRRKAIAISPGISFGDHGEGWVRIAVNIPSEELKSVMTDFVKYYQPLKTRIRRRRES